jgi:hypothetical protein
MNIPIKSCSVAFLFLSLAACGTTSSTVPFHEEALQGEADALVYVFRESSMVGGAVSWNVYLDGKVVGVLKQGAYMAFHVAPGAHAVRIGDTPPTLVGVIAEAAADNPEAFMAQAGQAYYIRSKGGDVAFLTRDQAMPSLSTMKYDTGQ